MTEPIDKQSIDLILRQTGLYSGIVGATDRDGVRRIDRENNRTRSIVATGVTSFKEDGLGTTTRVWRSKLRKIGRVNEATTVYRKVSDEGLKVAIDGSLRHTAVEHHRLGTVECNGLSW